MCALQESVRQVRGIGAARSMASRFPSATMWANEPAALSSVEARRVGGSHGNGERQ
jgi:hypothetical protein